MPSPPTLSASPGFVRVEAQNGVIRWCGDGGGGRALGGAGRRAAEEAGVHEAPAPGGVSDDAPRLGGT